MRARIALLTATLMLLPVIAQANDVYEYYHEFFRFDADGNLLREEPLGEHDYGLSAIMLDIDQAGNVYFGSNGNVFELTSTFLPVWGDPFLLDFGIFDLVAYDSGCVVVGGKYGRNIVWIENSIVQTTPDLPGWGNDVLIDAAGGVVVTGGVEVDVYYKDLLIARYLSPGVEDWIVQFNGEADKNDEGFALTTDAQGNVYVAGLSSDGEYTDMVVLKYDIDGVLQWSTVQGCPLGKNDAAKFIDLDDSGNVYVAGYCGFKEARKEPMVAKFDAEGQLQWIERLEATAEIGNYTTGLAVADDDRIVMVGMLRYQEEYEDHMFIAAYDADGQLRWQFIEERFSYNDKENTPTIAVDGQGDIYVVGAIPRGVYNTMKAIVYKFDRDGNLLWSKTDFSSDLSEGEYISSLRLDADDSLVIAGAYERSMPGDSDFSDDDIVDDNSFDTDDDNDDADDDDPSASSGQADDDNDDGCGCAVSERNPAAPLAVVMLFVGVLVGVGRRFLD